MEGDFMNHNEQNPENMILKKRLNNCRTAKGNLSKVPNELVIDVMRAWERWAGTSKSFYQSIGLKKQQLAIIIKRGKRIFKESADKLGPFTPVEVKPSYNNDRNPIVLRLDQKKSIHFYQVDHLVEFLKKAA